MSQKRTGHKVLFVESRPAAAAGIRSAFDAASPDARIEFVASPEAAIEVVKRETVDAVFVNEVQGGIDAAEFMLRLSAANRYAPTIMMSRRTDEDSVLRALRGGAFDCVASDEDSFGSYPTVALRAIARADTAQENTERDRAVIRSQKQWMSIIDAITDYIFVLDAGLSIIKVNRSFANAMNMHPREIVGRQIGEIFDTIMPIDASLLDVHRSGTSRTYEKKVGDEIYQVSIFPLQEDDRQLTIHVMKNITEVRRLKDQLYHSDKLASIGLLVSGVAHEINNPLTGTIAYTELLSMKVSDEDVKAELKKILDSAERCKKIVDNLLTFSRQRTPSKSLESMNDLIDRAVDLRSYWLRSNNIEIVREYDPAATIFADAQQIQQVVLNLLLNAEQAIVGAGQARGRITFITKYDKASRRVVLTVIDNGPGVPQKTASKIFDPFFTTKPVGVGTGLGLSIAHGIVTEHGGTIRFENLEGGGAAFVVELPIGTGMLTGAATNY